MIELRSLFALAGISLGLSALAPAVAQPRDGVVEGPVLSNPNAGLQVPLYTPSEAPNGAVTFESIPVKFGAGRIQLSGGYSVDSADWKAVAIGNDCTLTLVGPQTVLLAAHCVDARQSTGPSVRAANVTFDRVYPMQCKISPKYLEHPVNPTRAPRSSHDYALCLLDRPVPSSINPEVLGRHQLTTGSAVRLMGYGCIDLRITPAGTYAWKDGRVGGRKVLRMGDETIDATGISLYPSRSEKYVRTLATGAREPVLCPGDSGGPVLVATATAVGQPVTGRRIVAVNSAMGAKPGANASNPAFYSYLSPLETDEFKTFLESFAGPRDGRGPQVRQKVCGHNVPTGLQGCRR